MADAALSSAFVPVFSELLVEKRRREAIHLASALAGLLLVALSALTLVFILAAPVDHAAVHRRRVHRRSSTTSPSGSRR